MFRALSRCLLPAACCLVATATRAEEVSDFYQGRTLTVVVAHEPGTGFDVYARVLVRHLGRHVPGAPAVVVQNMPGAGGVTGANWLYNIAPRDGSVIATVVHTVMLDRLLNEQSAVRFDPNRFNWIGNIESSVGTCGISERSGFKSFDEMLEREIVFGGAAITGALSQGSFALRNLVGAKIKMVHGYKGSADMKLALTRGEIQGMCGLPISTLKSFWRDAVEAGHYRPIIQLNHEPHPWLGKIRHLYEFARTDEDRQVFDLVFGSLVLGRIYMAPPEVPAPRVKALRAAFDATMKDAAFLADAEKGHIEVSATTGDAVAELIRRYTSAPKAVIDRAVIAVKPDAR